MLFYQQRNDELEKAFAACLDDCFDVRTWLIYTRFAQREATYIAPTDAEPFAPRDHVIRAFDRAIARVGYDIEAAELWSDYIRFYRDLAVHFPLAFL